MVVLYFGCLIHSGHLNYKLSIIISIILNSCLLSLCFSSFNLGLVAFLSLSYEVSEHSDFVIVVLIEIKSIPMAEPYLE